MGPVLRICQENSPVTSHAHDVSFWGGHGGKQTYTDLYITSSYFVVYKIGQGADSSFDEYVTCDPKNIHPDGCPKIPPAPTQYWIVCAAPCMYLENPDTYTHISVYIYISQKYTHVYAYAAYVYVRGISCMRMNHEVLRFPLIIVLRDCRPLSFLAFSTLFCPGNDGTARISFERPGVAVLATFELPST